MRSFKCKREGLGTGLGRKGRAMIDQPIDCNRQLKIVNGDNGESKMGWAENVDGGSPNLRLFKKEGQ